MYPVSTQETSQAWYYSQDGRRQGPVEHSEIQQLLLTERISKDSLVWTKGMPTWEPASGLGAFGSDDDSATRGKRSESEWHYADGDDRHGPIDQESLQRLLREGQLSSRLLVWRKGMADWSTADAIPEFRSSCQQNVETQSGRGSDSRTSFKTHLLDFASDTKRASETVALKTERTKLIQVSLPSAYRKLGKEVYKNQPLRSEFCDLIAAIDNLQQQIETVRQNGKHQEAGPLSGKAKVLAQMTKSAVAEKLLQRNLRMALRKLGQTAHERVGTQAGSAATVNSIESLQARQNEMSDRIAALNRSSRLLSPKKMLMGALSLIHI